MKGVEPVLNKVLLKYGFWPLWITVIVVLLIIIITAILVYKELKGKK